jgi:hypothetical protein
VDAPEAEVFGLFQAGNHAEHPLLLGNPEPGLEAHEIPHLSGTVFPAKLHHGMRLPSGLRIRQSHRLHGAEPEGFPAAPGHLLDGQTSLEVRNLIELVSVKLVCADQLVDEPFIRIGVHRGVEVVVA